MTTVLEVHDLKKSFDGLHAVDDVSFEILPGQIFGLLGPNGAGKTTTISMVCGLLRPDAGQVTVAGHNVDADAASAKKVMGVVPQEIALYEELSAEENLKFWGKLSGLTPTEAGQRADELLGKLALADRRHDRVQTYSGGMKRRVNIGCALMHDPKLLLLDEPTVGIDPQARANILEFVRGLTQRGTGVLYTTHYLEEAEAICDRIGIIDHGRLLAEGSLSELQDSLGGDRLFVLEGDFSEVQPTEWEGFAKRFRVIRQSDQQLAVASLSDRHPSECLRELLELPVEIQNAAFKLPNLNDVFLQLTGRELRE